MDMISQYACPLGLAGTGVVVLFILRKYMNGGWFYGKERIPGKTVIITGANTGIGKETARELACRGGRIILACRDLKRAEEARAEIVAETGNENVIVKHLNLASMASIRAFAKDINATESRLDILINNAGVMWCPKMLTEDGFEMQIGTNHMGHFLLTNLLLDKIKTSGPSRIINVASLAHSMSGPIDLDDLNREKSYDKVVAYSHSKLANILFTRELAKRLKNTGVTVNALHPGAVTTDLQRHTTVTNSVFGLFMLPPFSWIFFKNAVHGAQTTLYCALASELEGVSGKYFSDCKEKSPAKYAQDDDAAKKLWDISKKWTKLS